MSSNVLHETHEPFLAMGFAEASSIKKPDLVNHPPHYQGKTIEVIQVIEEFGLGYHLGNVIKYVLRAPNKGGIEDLKKALWYLDRYIQANS